jgi:2-desacetyl-2-hydroxyethyl bacteriochlorophyllide A dehydrogenase
MKAVQLIGHGAPGKFQLAEFTDLRAGPEEVILKVHFCGVNRLDLWLEEGGLPIPIKLPRVPGSEIAGEIIALGEDVDEWQIGDRVAVQGNLFCGDCEFCLRGDESLCLHSTILGVQHDGGYAEQVAVPWRSLVRLPDNVDYATAAGLILAGSTAMHMLTDRTEVTPGDWVLVVAGASGVGTAAIQIAKELGAHVIATASNEAKKNLALSLGAEQVIETHHPDWPAAVRKITNRRGVNIVIEHLGGKTLEQCLHCLARGGVVVTCGATAGRQVSFNLWPFFVKQQRLVGSNGRNRTDLVTTLEWAAQGKLKPVIDQVFPLEQTPEALQRLRARNVLGKLLVKVAGN